MAPMYPAMQTVPVYSMVQQRPTYSMFCSQEKVFLLRHLAIIFNGINSNNYARTSYSQQAVRVNTLGTQDFLIMSQLSALAGH